MAAQKGRDGPIPAEGRTWAIRGFPGAGDEPYLAGARGLKPDPPGQSVGIGNLAAADRRCRGLATAAANTVVTHSHPFPDLLDEL
jgi:hypothetical protein